MGIYNQPGKDRAVEFPVFLSATVGRDLWLVGTKYEYELVAGDDRAGTISLLGKFWLAHMACREGDGFLTRRRKHGWEFVIEAEDRSQVGRYSGGRWRAGGTILMASSDVEVDAGREHERPNRGEPPRTPLPGLRRKPHRASTASGRGHGKASSLHAARSG